MTVPLRAPVHEEPLDPKDVRPWGIDITREGGDDPFPMLETGENVASYTLGPSIEAIAAGMSIKSGSGYDPQLVGDRVYYYPAIASGSQHSSMFDDPGTVLGVELTITTTATPPNIVKRTVGHLTVQQ